MRDLRAWRVLFGMYACMLGLGVVCRTGGVYPRKRFTITVARGRDCSPLSAVSYVESARLLWTATAAFQVFGLYAGHFYAAVSTREQLLHVEEKASPSAGSRDSIPLFRGLHHPADRTRLADSTIGAYPP